MCCMVITNPQQTGHPVMFATKGFAEAVGHHREELLGRSLFQVLKPARSYYAHAAPCHVEKVFRSVCCCGWLLKLSCKANLLHLGLLCIATVSDLISDFFTGLQYQ